MTKRTRSAGNQEEQHHTPPKRRYVSRSKASDPIEDEIRVQANGTASIDKETASVTNVRGRDAHNIRKTQHDRSTHKIIAVSSPAPASESDGQDDEPELANRHLPRPVSSGEDCAMSDSDDQAEPGAELLIDTNSADLIDAVVPVKRPRGRPKGRRKARTPSPAPDLPAHELFFFHNRTSASQTSNNTLPAHSLLNHDDYNSQIQEYRDPHEDDIERLKDLHYRSFEQWQFEVDQGYSLCFYGFGSKRALLMDFVDYIHQTAHEKLHIAVVNGYNTSLIVKDVLNLVAGFFDAETTWPGQPAALLDAILRESRKMSGRRMFLVVHNLDSVSLRKSPAQSAIAALAALPQVSLLASCDSLNFALLWDVSLLRQLNFLYHDATTFEPWKVEIDAVEEINALLGRNSRRLAGKDGVGYVLRSLPENARNLFRILVAEQLALGDLDFTAHSVDNLPEDEEDDDRLGVSDEELAARQQNTPSKRGRGRPKKTRLPAKHATPAQAEGVEYRTLYHKAVEEFVCSSEINFRTLLKEFHDHQMIESRKDSMGTERLVVPFRREELEAILEEL